MALLCMAVHDTADNKREEFTRATLDDLSNTLIFNKHRLVLIDNGSVDSSAQFLDQIRERIEDQWDLECVTVIHNKENEGTARAVNKGLRMRQPGEYCIKMDNDVLVLDDTLWVERMEDVMRRMPDIGVLGLKRNDLMESTYAINTDQRSRLLEVPHQIGQRWEVVEECKQVMGTCTMLNPKLLDRIGYFYQVDGLYGFDDSLMCVRSTMAGFRNCFLHGIEIDHIDPGGTEYTEWKKKYAGEMIGRFAQVEAAYRSGAKDIYYDGQ